MKIGMLVEGKIDDYALKTLAGRIIGERRNGVGIEIRKNRGHGDLLSYAEKVKRIVEPLISLHPDITSIIVVVDRDSKVERVAMAENMERSLLSLNVDPSPRYCLAVESLESWLSTDSDGLSHYLRIRNVPLPPLEMYDSVGWMKAQFRRAGKRFDKEVACRRLAESVDLDRIALRNHSFARFRDTIHSAILGA